MGPAPPRESLHDEPLLAVLVLGLLAVSAPTGADRARCSPPAPRSLESPASFATDLVGSLGRALDGTRRIDTTREQAASDLIQAARLVQEDFACAARHVDPYAKSGSDVIRGAARNLAEKYRALPASLDGQLQWLRYVDSESRAGREPDPARAEALLDKAVAQKNEAAHAAATANDFATNGAAGWYQVLSNGTYRSADAP